VVGLTVPPVIEKLQEMNRLGLVIALSMFLAACAPSENACRYDEHEELYRGSVLLVVQTASGIVVKNISGQPTAIRVSWDGKDPKGIGNCPDFPDDCFIDNSVEAKGCVSSGIKNHTSVQVWAWGTSGKLIDSCDLPVSEPIPSNASSHPDDIPTPVRAAATRAVPQMLIPLYSYPNWYGEANYIWDDIALANERVQITVIINPSNGPGDGSPSADYQHGIDELRRAGVTILGYVYTSYGVRDLDTVKAEADLYCQHFDVDGIFFDEVASSDDMCHYYEELHSFVNSLPGMNIVVINPGTSPAECYFSRPTCDTGVIFEGYSSEWPGYWLPSYVFDFPSARFAVLVHSVPDSDTMQSHIDLVMARNIGYVYLTDDTLDNPWDTLPVFWSAEIDQITSNYADQRDN
jgi:hypothetical protein